MEINRSSQVSEVRKETFIWPMDEQECTRDCTQKLMI